MGVPDTVGRPVGGLRGQPGMEVVEQGSGDVLVFLHGEDGLQFCAPVLDELARSFRVVAPHLPGFGGSVREEHVRRPRDIALVLDELLDDYPPAVVVGCSFGAWVALELAVLARDRVRALVLASPAGIKVSGRDVRDFEDIWTRDHDSLRELLYRPGGVPSWSGLADADLRYLTRCQELVARYSWAPYMHEPALRHWARRVSAPTLVVRGGQDRFCRSQTYAEDVAACIGAKGAATVTLPEAGRRIEEEEPAVLGALVRDHVAELSGSVELRGA